MTKPNLVAQILTNVINLILLPNIHWIVKKLLQNKFSSKNDKKINRFLFLTLKKAILFSDYCYIYQHPLKKLQFSYFWNNYKKYNLFFIIKISALFHQLCLFFFQMSKRWCYSFYNKISKIGKKTIAATIDNRNIVNFSTWVYRTWGLCWL